jgi:hypothetical protein
LASPAFAASYYIVQNTRTELSRTPGLMNARL